jgi:hypothetical protein
MADSKNPDLYFRSQKIDVNADPKKTRMVDHSDVLGNAKRQRIEIQHVPSGEIVMFKAFLSQFDDQYQTEFAQEQVFGRMDPIQSYRGTTRQINLAWDVPSSSLLEAEDHMERCSTLMTMLYPVYTKAGQGSDAKVMTAPPIFKIKFANLITNTATGTSKGGVATNGLFGTISGFSYSPDLDSGFFNTSDGNILPQTISLSCLFTVVHTHDLGWDNKGKVEKANKSYPYGADELVKGKAAATAQSPANKVGSKQAQANDKNSTNTIAGGTK